MWCIMNEDIRKAFKDAREKANVILSMIRYNKEKDELIPTNEIIRAVEKKMNVEVKFATYDFKKLVDKNIPQSLNVGKCGAAMCVSQNNGKSTAAILLNERENARKQRFSLVHELGHLMLQGTVCNDGFRVSTHIDMDLTSIPTEILEEQDNNFLLQEQQANIFALLVLMPGDMFERVKEEKDSISEIARVFGVEKDAVYSRFILDLA